MTGQPKGRSLLRLAVAGAVAVGAPFALAGTANAAPQEAWEELAQCESGGDWSINTGNGYYGGLQFNPTTWRAFGGEGMPHTASKAEQIAVAERTLAAQGWGAWPSCSKEMGLTGYDASPGKKITASKDSSDESESSKSESSASSESSKSESSESESTEKASSGSEPTSTGDGNYTVESGDTLSEIAAAHGTTWQQLFEQNRDVLSDPDVLSIGQQLNV